MSTLPPEESHAPSQIPRPVGAPDAVGTLQLNFWLSAFFTWLPALIFWLVAKDKRDRRATELDVANLNFSLLRTAVIIITGVLGVIPYIGWVIVILGWIAGIGLFIVHVIAASRVAATYRTGMPADPFAFNIRMVK